MAGPKGAGKSKGGKGDQPAPARVPSNPPGGSERRSAERILTELQVDYRHGETFLFSYITNISEMGIFIYSTDPLPPGTALQLRFAPPDGKDQLELPGEVVWINPYRPDGQNLNPGMGVRFKELRPEQRERLVDLVRTIAYLREDDGRDPMAS